MVRTASGHFGVTTTAPAPKKKRRRTRRDEIYDWVCAYANEMDGPTPSINEISRHFGLNYKTAYYHVTKLIAERRLLQERGKLVVVGSEWIEPAQTA